MQYADGWAIALRGGKSGHYFVILTKYLVADNVCRARA